MSRARVGALAALVAVVVVFLAVALRPPSSELSPRSPAERPALLLLTSLPIVFGEDFSLESGGGHFDKRSLAARTHSFCCDACAEYSGILHSTWSD